MDILPSESQEFARLEMRLEAGDLTLDEIRGIEDQLLLRSDSGEKTKKIGEGLFARLSEKRKALIDRQIVQLEGQKDLGSKIAKLHLLSGELSPEEAEGETLALFREVPLEEDSRVQQAALLQLEEIQFTLHQPIAHDLDAGALSSNFVSRMRQIAKTLSEQNSLAPLRELNQTQQREVYRYARGGQ